jgi:uncharacterized membrane protein (DUF485 family)
MPLPPPPGDATTRLRALASARARVAVSLTAAMIAIYFGFIVLIAFRKDLLARTLVPGLSVGILLGALVIVASWLLTWFYVRWSNKHYDEQLRDIGRASVSR